MIFLICMVLNVLKVVDNLYKFWLAIGNTLNLFALCIGGLKIKLTAGTAAFDN